MEYKNEKKWKVELSKKTGSKKLFIELGTWISILGSLKSSNSFKTPKTHIIYFYDIELICYKQIEYHKWVLKRKSKIIVFISIWYWW